jgi:hypothetical protein
MDREVVKLSDGSVPDLPLDDSVLHEMNGPPVDNHRMSDARLFVLDRVEDISGVSGTGVIAEGIEFSDGVVALRWIVPPGRQGSGFPTSVVFHDNGMESVRAVHGHNGSTIIRYLDTAQEHP